MCSRCTTKFSLPTHMFNMRIKITSALCTLLSFVPCIHLYKHNEINLAENQSFGRRQWNPIGQIHSHRLLTWHVQLNCLDEQSFPKIPANANFSENFHVNSSVMIRIRYLLWRKWGNSFEYVRTIYNSLC